MAAANKRFFWVRHGEAEHNIVINAAKEAGDNESENLRFLSVEALRWSRDMLLGMGCSAREGKRDSGSCTDGNWSQSSRVSVPTTDF